MRRSAMRRSGLVAGLVSAASGPADSALLTFRHTLR